MIIPYPILIPINNNTDISIDLKIFKYFPLIINIILIILLFIFFAKSYYHRSNYILNENTIYKDIEKILFNRYIMIYIIMIIIIFAVNVIFYTTL